MITLSLVSIKHSISSPSVLPGPTVVPTLTAPTLWAATPAPVNLDFSLGLRTQVGHLLVLLLTSLNAKYQTRT